MDPKFEKAIEDFPNTALPNIYELLNKYKANKQLVIFKSRIEADEYLNEQFGDCLIV